MSEQAWEQQWGQGRCPVGVEWRLLKLRAWRIACFVFGFLAVATDDDMLERAFLDKGSDGASLE